MNNLPERKVLRRHLWDVWRLVLAGSDLRPGVDKTRASKRQAWLRLPNWISSTMASSSSSLCNIPVIGQICELWCYEGGPFRYGRGLL